MADDDDYQEKVCKVYDKDDFFTVLVQIILAIFALGSLWFKRMYEIPRRKFMTWFYDVSKQGFGACYAHVLNMVIASVIAQNPRGETQLKDQCAWYGMSYLIDTTLGLVLAIILVKLLDYVANKFHWDSLKKSGVYHGEDGWVHWIHQVLAWLGILTIVKMLVYLFMWGLSEPLAVIGGILFAPFEGNIRFELLFVMIFFPGFLNVIYFWIADSYLQAKAEHSEAHEDELMQDKKKHLLGDARPVTVEDEVASARVWTDPDLGHAPRRNDIHLV
jgi:hypothetical protein